jgi:hypothetical protein
MLIKFEIRVTQVKFEIRVTQVKFEKFLGRRASDLF